MNKTLELTSLNKDIIRIIGKYLLFCDKSDLRHYVLEDLKLTTKRIKECLDKNKYYNKIYYKHCDNFNNRKFQIFSGEKSIWTIV
jgi:hypothetical protein